MTEHEYIEVGNLVQFRIADKVLRDVMPGDEYGVPEKLYKEILIKIGNMINHLSNVIEGEII